MFVFAVGGCFNVVLRCGLFLTCVVYDFCLCLGLLLIIVLFVSCLFL